MAFAAEQGAEEWQMQPQRPRRYSSYRSLPEKEGGASFARKSLYFGWTKITTGLNNKVKRLKQMF